MTLDIDLRITERDRIAHDYVPEAGRYRFHYFETENGKAVFQAYLGGRHLGTGAVFDPLHECVDRISIERVPEDSPMTALQPYIDLFWSEGEWTSENTAALAR